MRWRRFVPAAPARVHLALAASMWTLVGVGLLTFGVATAWQLPGAPTRALAVVVAALGLGAAKGRWILTRAAERIASRIVERGDGRCLGGFLSPASWLMVAVMVAVGRLVRTGHWLSTGLIAVLYIAVGAGLLLASIGLWRAWRRWRRGSPPIPVAPSPSSRRTQ